MKNINIDDTNAVILDREPSDWKNLQVLVNELFSQLGYVSELKKKIQTVRSTIEIDCIRRKKNFWV